MKIRFTALLSLAMLLNTLAADPDTRCYEMRTYHAAPGKMEALNKRFRDHTVALFAKHGITNVGYWERLDQAGKPEDVLTYVLSYPSRSAREQSWKAFMADPDWQAAYKASERDGRLVTKAESLFLSATDFSPVIEPGHASDNRVFELRIYKCEPGRLPNLLARFRDHTKALFAKHGMTQLGYWTPMDKAHGADDTLVYILAHRSKDAAAASFKAFREDPEWIAARKASEEKAGGSLTVKDGVQSIFMRPTDYSPTK